MRGFEYVDPMKDAVVHVENVEHKNKDLCEVAKTCKFLFEILKF